MSDLGEQDRLPQAAEGTAPALVSTSAAAPPEEAATTASAVAPTHEETAEVGVSGPVMEARPEAEVAPEDVAEDAAEAPVAPTELAAEVPAAAEPVEPEEALPPAEESPKDWYILKVQVNREDSIRDALLRRIKIQGLEQYFSDIIVPTEDVAEFNKSGKRRIVKRKLYPGYILVHMALNDETWFLVRETPGVGDFTGSAGRPTPMDTRDVERILRLGAAEEEGGAQIRTAIPFKAGARVRVKEGNFQNFEGDVASIDQANGRITVMINIFGRSTPVELDHWQVEAL